MPVRHRVPPRRSRLGSTLRTFGPALAAFAAARLAGLIVLTIWGGDGVNGVLDRLAGYDGEWYLGIASDGYGGVDVGTRDLAFFPLYPMLITGLEPLLPFGARNTALLVSWAGALAAAAGLFALGDQLHDRRVGIALAVLWGCLPHSAVQLMTYTEGLFTALAVWTLLALLRGRWVTAGLLCMVAGASRPTAAVLIGVVGLAGIVAVVQRRDGWRPCAAVAMAPLGWIGYLGWVAERTGRLDGWFHVQQAGWGSSFDGGRYTLRVAQDVLGKASALNLVVVTVLLLAAVTLLVISALDRQPWQLLLFSAATLVITVGSAGYYHSKGRFLMPAIGLLLPVAVALGRAGWAKAVTVLVALGIASAWYGGHLLLVWTYSP